MIRAMMLLGALFSANLPALAASAAQPPVDSAVDALLSGYELVPTAADWARVGSTDDVAAKLMAVADDPGAGVAQVRAMSSLAHFPSLAVLTFLDSHARDASLPARLRGKALIAWAGVAREAAAPAIAQFLAEPDAALREDAARALRLLAAPEVAAFLRARAAVEPVPYLQEVLRGAATRVDSNREALVAKKASVPSVTMPRDVPRVTVTPR